MCGICGIINLDKKPIDKTILTRMNDALFHRGPDDKGEYIKNNIGFANSRLAIIDLSHRAHQPMKDISGEYWITFNGEIYNYKEISTVLKEKGYSFISDSDTETILYSYIEYGDKCVDYFIGQFAFAIWDNRKNKLFVARDRIGIIPLYYAVIGKTFIFASEIKAILSSGLVSKEINKQSLYHFFSMYAVPNPNTIFKDIQSLSPGFTLSVSDRGVYKNQYWDVPVGLWMGKKNNEKYLKNKLLEMLESAISYASVSDVPIGVFLSGGIDSSLIVALLSQNLKFPLNTYTCYSEDGKAYDERQYARAVARRYKTKHTEYSIDEKEILNDLGKIVYHLDQPDGGGLESYYISKYSKGIKVAISGAGGDELFSGYHEEIYKFHHLSLFYQLIPKSIKKIIISQAIRFFSNKKEFIENVDQYLEKKSPEDQRFFLYFPFQDIDKKRLFSQEWLPKNIQSTIDYFDQYHYKVRNLHPVDRFMYVDLKTFTPTNILQNMDVMSMAHSLEVRSPLLDHRLIELAAEIPPSFKYRSNQGKYIIRQIAKLFLPKTVLNHRKTGFGMPRGRYMHTFFKKYILEFLSERSIRQRGIFNPKTIQMLLANYYKQSYSNMLMKDNLKIWTLFILELWFRIYIDRSIYFNQKIKLDDLL